MPNNPQQQRTELLSTEQRSLAFELLNRWSRYSERYWSTAAVGGFYGTGFNNWGVQTNQKYFGALSALAALPDSPADRQWATERALSALRFSLATHVSGSELCSDGTQWGHTWISALGIERMFFGVHLLREELRGVLTEEDQAALRRVLISEAEWLLHSYQRGQHREITGGLWGESGRNDPESNLWNGALLWRASTLYPDHPNRELWQERAHCFLINGVSIPSDEEDGSIIAGKPIKDRFVGANFFPNYALDHHGYLNVGYMVICVSNAAMLHFDLKAANLKRPETLDHHQAELWERLRCMLFSNGRLARIGGDARVRYSYCQEYLLPALLYAADHLGEKHAPELIAAQLQLILQEAKYSGDGSFYGRRLSELKTENPYYFTRLESDRACALAMLLSYAPQVALAESANETFEESVSGSWHEPEHGAALHRCATRFASFSWRSYGRTQGLCLPPEKGHLPEWEQNLSSTIRFMGDQSTTGGNLNSHRQVLWHQTSTFEGGFLTVGEIAEGMNLKVAEGWSGTSTARHQIAFAALPDGHTVLGLERARNADKRSYLREMKGLHFVFANDFYNGQQRRLICEYGEHLLTDPAVPEAILSLGGNWSNIEDSLGIIGLYGADELSLHRIQQRRGGAFRSLATEELCYPCQLEMQVLPPNALFLDIGWATIASANAAQTKAIAHAAKYFSIGDLRAVQLPGQDGRTYGFICNFGSSSVDTKKLDLAHLDWDLELPSTLAAGEAKVLGSGSTSFKRSS